MESRSLAQSRAVARNSFAGFTGEIPMPLSSSAAAPSRPASRSPSASTFTRPGSRLAGQGYAAKQLRQVLQFRSKAAVRVGDIHFPGQFTMAVAQLPLEARVLVAPRQLDKGFQLVGNAGHGRVHDDGPQALLAAAAHQARDRVPAGGRGHTGAAELEHYPGHTHALSTLPGFMIPRGSMARLSARIT